MIRAIRAFAGSIVLVGVAAGQAGAIELGEAGEPLTLDVHGFASQGFLFTTENEYLAKSERGSFEFAEVGLNLTVPLTERLRTGMQLFARDLGPIGDYEATIDWFYLDYRWQDWLGVRAGRVKLPFGLYNDSSDIDAARTPILLPQSVYPTENRDFLLAQTGVELYGYVTLCEAGALDYRAYAGTIFLDPTQQPGSPFQVLDLTIPYVVGGRLFWETPIEWLRVGGSVQALRLESTLLSSMSPDPFELDIPAVLWVASVEYAPDKLLLALEYSRWHVDLESSDPSLLPPDTSTVSERAYAMAGYRVRPWFQPGVYYSLYYPDVEERSGREAKAHVAALTLRFDINPNWLLKVEGHYNHGTAGLDSSLNDGRELEELERNWGLFLLKTTAYF